MPEETDSSQPAPEDAGLPGGVPPDEMFARAMQSVRMTGGAGAWVPPTVEEAAEFFPGYEVLAMLGRGAMGAVFKARQRALDRVVAIKLLPLEITVERNFVNRFRREARAMAMLSHPNIIAVHDFGQTSQGQLFFVMEFVEGANLAEILKQTRLDADQVLALTSQVCEAVAYAHGKGIVHRDIKPANVMVNAEGQVKMADFGLARLTGSEADIYSTATTGTGIMLGTPAYMAPEQRHGLPTDHRADIYSLGVMLYEMLCGQLPRGVFALPSQCLGCDERLDQIVTRTMQQEPDLRYQSTVELKADVDSARHAPPPPPPQPPHRPRLRRRAMPAAHWVSLGAAGLVLALGLAGFYAVTSNQTPQKPAAPLADSDPQPDEIKVPKPMPVQPKTGPVEIPPPVVAKIEPAPPKPDAPPAGQVTPPAPAVPPPVVAIPIPDAPVFGPPWPPPPDTAKTAPEAPIAPVPAAPEPPAAAPAPKPLSITGKWLAEQEPQWQAAFVREVSAPFTQGVVNLRKQYTADITLRFNEATRGGNTEVAVIYRDELQILGTGAEPPASNQAPSASRASSNTPAALATLRVNYHFRLGNLKSERIAKAKAFQSRYDATLAKNQLLLTQHQRLDEALEIKAKREQLATDWLKPPVVLVETANVGGGGR